MYAFNHEEAILAFEEAARLDPSAAMAVGVALASGRTSMPPWIRLPNDGRGMPYKGSRHRARTSAAEQAYIDAIGKRYGSDACTTALDKAYASDACVWRQYPTIRMPASCSPKL